MAQYCFISKTFYGIIDHYFIHLNKKSDSSHIFRVNDFLSDLIQNVFKRSLDAQFLDYHYFDKHSWGEIIVIGGSPCSGKTSIVNALLALEPDLCVDGIDIKREKEQIKCIQKNHSAEMEALKKLGVDPSAVARSHFFDDLIVTENKTANEILYQINPNICYCECRSWYDDLLYNFVYNGKEVTSDDSYQSAFERSKQGKRIILDDPNVRIVAMTILKKRLQGQFKGSVRFVLAYCPFRLLPQRLEYRNRLATINGRESEKRLLTMVFEDFFLLSYEPRQFSKDSLDYLTNNEVSDLYRKTLLSEVCESQQKSFNYDHNNIDEKVTDFLCTSGINNMDEFGIEPAWKFLYDLILDTSQLSAAECARIIHERRRGNKGVTTLTPI